MGAYELGGVWEWSGSYFGFNNRQGESNGYGLRFDGTNVIAVARDLSTGLFTVSKLQVATPTLAADAATKGYVDSVAGAVVDGADLSGTVSVNPLNSFVWKDYSIIGGAGSMQISSKRQEEFDYPLWESSLSRIDWGLRSGRLSGTLGGAITEGSEIIGGVREGYVEIPLSSGNPVTISMRAAYPRGPSNYFWQDGSGAVFPSVALGYNARITSLLGSSVDLGYVVTDTSATPLAAVNQSRVGVDATYASIGYTALTLNAGTFTEGQLWNEALTITPVGGDATIRISARAEFKF